VGAIAPVDPTVPPSRFKRLATTFALTRFGTWFYSEVAARVDATLMRATRGRVNLGARLVPVVLLTARGAKTGIERTVPLVYFTDGDDVIVIASSFGRPKYPSWYRNVTANPEVTLWADGRSGRYRAREVDGPDHDELLARARQLYRGYGVYEGKVEGIRHIPVLRLSPTEADGKRPTP
jgi:deazaflavin-dependent oxidoreductase (nitroreductase family)